MDINFLLSIVIWFGGSSTIATLTALLVDLLKRIPGLIKDGTSATVAFWINMVCLIGFAVYFFTSPAATFAGMDETLRVIMLIVQFVLGSASQLFISPAVHDRAWVSNLPILGYSLTDANYANRVDEYDEDAG
jgi:hypothetical protein